MAEIEHFCDPVEKTHPKFENVRDTEMLLYSAANQMDGKSAELHLIGQAVDKVKIKAYCISASSRREILRNSASES